MIKKWIPIGMILLLMGILSLYGWDRAVSFEILRYHHAELTEYVNDSPLMTPFLFMGFLAFCILLSAPGILILYLLGGFLFPQPFSSLYVLLGSTLGGSLLFSASKMAIGEHLKKTSIPLFLQKMDNGFQNHPCCYLLFMRFFPFFPFWLANIIPAIFNIHLRTFIWTTFVGMIPFALIFTCAGRGFNTIFESQSQFDLFTLISTKLKLILGLLAALSLSPLIFSYFQTRNVEKI